nr:cobalamin biosynthesis protein CobG [Novosphingobium sp. PhB165]
MMAGDGLLVRVKPRLGRLTPAQAVALGEAALAHGSGALDLTRRANLQIRGVSEADWPRLLDRLLASGLVDADATREARRNILVSPAWHPGDDSYRIARELDARLDELPALPGKAGFVIDAGPVPMLSAEPGDFRIERGRDGMLQLRADGRSTGIGLAPGGEVTALIDLTRWFMASGGASAGRMARHSAPLPDWATGTAAPVLAAPLPLPGRHAMGAAYGLPFGRVSAQAFLRLAQVSGVAGLRTTPWRILLAEGAGPIEHDGLSIDPHHSLLRADACPGAPDCPQASVETRTLAARLAPHVSGHLHVSGCAKGCAHPAAADVVVTGREGAYDLSFSACAGSPPRHSGLDAADLFAHFGVA